MKDDKQFTQDALSRLTPVEPSAELRRMVAEIPIKHPREVRSLWPFANLWMPSLSIAAVAALGLFVGRTLSEEPMVDSWAQSSDLAEVVTDGDSAIDRSNRSATSVAIAESSLDENESDAELDELLVLATAGDFVVDDWDLSEAPESEPQEGTF